MTIYIVGSVRKASHDVGDVRSGLGLRKRKLIIFNVDCGFGRIHARPHVKGGERQGVESERNQRV